MNTADNQDRKRNMQMRQNKQEKIERNITE